ncbi:LD-carboxypeptidase [Streptomyces sp. CAI-85]|uniref:S66 peptidase family protein n=1 Tax=Streptomyces sp. CAI-85 TaxID=1472662 RepID=UPI0015870D3E|nr:LD-carboxypeptidase [Streptomyces sp. CAI-85]NUV61137.1 LD-carboxypeptidase [Streptomyces sp. CAI-85]
MPLTLPSEGLIRPVAPKPGDRVAVIAASGPTDQENLETGLESLRGLGFQPEVFASARATGEYLAGDDALRARDLTAALTDPAFTAVFCANGGYGAQRTLELVDWDAIGTPTPRTVIGFSDVTALMEAVAVKLGWKGLFGPMPAIRGFHPGRADFDGLAALLTDPASVKELRFPDSRPLVGGTAEGVTLGGTVTLLACSLGTDTSLPARGGIVLLEDVDEETFRLDRFLTQLRRAGYFDGAAGIVCGTFTDCGTRERVEQLLHDRLADLGIPVLVGADIGHGVPQQTFPIGTRARLDADGGVLTFLDPVLG